MCVSECVYIHAPLSINLPWYSSLFSPLPISLSDLPFFPQIYPPPQYLSHTPSLPPSLSLTHTHSLTPSLPLTHTHSLPPSPSLSLSPPLLLILLKSQLSADLARLLCHDFLFGGTLRCSGSLRHAITSHEVHGQHAAITCFCPPPIPSSSFSCPLPTQPLLPLFQKGCTQGGAPSPHECKRRGNKARIGNYDRNRCGA